MTVRKRYEKRHENLLPKKPAYKPHRSGPHRAWNKQSLRDLSREDLEALIDKQAATIADQAREILELQTMLEEKDRENAQLRNDLAWEGAAKRQLEGVATPASATVVCPDGLSAEVLHAVTRASQEISPPTSYGHPDYAAWWSKLIRARIPVLSARELHWLLADNNAHLDALESLHPGAGVGLRGRINARIAELEAQQ